MVGPSEERASWARRYIAVARDAPAYGSPEWLALPHGPEKIAAVVRAAEAWATDHELALRRLKLQEDGAYVDRRDAHRREYENKSYKPHPANRGNRWAPAPTQRAS